jgi:hypothetical protein
MSLSTGPLHAYLAGAGRDGRGRLIADVLALSDERLEAIHDYIQWLFPLPTRSGAQPDAPTLTAAEIEAIRTDSRATDNLQRAADRMLRFYGGTDWWLAPHDHNHLRITRIIRSLRLLLGSDPARRFHRAVLALNDAAGSPVNAGSLRFWAEAAQE